MKVQQTKIEKLDSISPKCFIGRSNKFYVKNPFGTPTKYTYAVYESVDAYENMAHLPVYVDAATAMADFGKEIDLPAIVGR